MWLPALMLGGAGVMLVVASVRCRTAPGRLGLAFGGMGAVLLSIGAGLLPHLIKRGLTLPACASLIALGGGLWLVVVGVRALLAGRGRLVGAAGSLGSLVLVAATLSVIAPSVAATHVPDVDIGATPASLGVPYESVTVTTADGVDLAGWYLSGTNGAGVVVLHGAGSTRSAVLEQAVVLVTGGYSVLLLDARGHGDSGGRAMDFGWYGDRDIAAGTGFLASRPEIDPGRIGVVGFSMGGEEAIGAAAANPSIRAVVAEGATARSAADTPWLADVYGWRGWVQQQLERAQDVVTQCLTDASRPTSLRTAVQRATDTRFLLISAGTVRDEGHAAAHIRSGAPDRVELWSVDGADHVGGYTTAPTEWRRRVLQFLGDALG